MKSTVKTIEMLSGKEPLREIEVMLTIEELKKFGQYCTHNNIKFNDWIRQLAHEALSKER